MINVLRTESQDKLNFNIQLARKVICDTRPIRKKVTCMASYLHCKKQQHITVL